MPDDGNSMGIAGTSFVPQIEAGYIHFDVHIPLAVQESFTGRHFEVGEDFQVRMKFRRDMPVTFIVCKNSRLDIARPSHAVYLLREFIRSEMLMRGAPIQLRILGPSPFPADFFILPAPTNPIGTTQKEPIEFEHIKYRGAMSDINCYWLSSAFANSIMGAKQIFRELAPELSLYYAIVSKRSQRFHKGWHIDKLLGKLVAYYDAEKLQVKIARFFKAGKLSRSLILQVRLIQLLSSKHKIKFSREIAELYEDDNPGTLREYLEEELAESFPGEDSGTENLAQLFESRRSREMSLFMLVVASILGGAVGALLNHLFTR